MRVAESVRELERQYEAMRARAEAAEGVIRVYEAREHGKEIAKKAQSSDDWKVIWKNGDADPTEFIFSPGLWLLGLAESFLKDPRPFELRVESSKAAEPAAEDKP